MPDDARFIDAYVTATGQKQRVPAHYFDHPILSKGLRKTPLTRAAEGSAPRTTRTTTTRKPPTVGDKGKD